MLTPDRAAYWSSGGEVLALNHVLSDDDAGALRDVYADEVRAAVRAGDLATAKRALQLTEELARAIGLARRWRRAAGPVHAGFPSASTPAS